MKNAFALLFVGLLVCNFYAEEVGRKVKAEEDNKISNKEDVNLYGSEEESIKQIIERAYIQGIHGNQDENIVKSGFHQNFNMLVLQADTIQKFTVDEWLKRIEKMKADNPRLWEAKTAYDFKLVDVTGPAAVAKLDVYRGEVHFSTDYMLLYKFEEGWRIVSKIFAIPDKK